MELVYLDNGKGALAEDDVDANRRPMRKCTINPEHILVRLGEEKPFSVILPKKISEDCIWTWTNECLLNSRVVSLLRSSSLTGFNLLPARATRVKGGSQNESELPSLWRLGTIGWGGVASPESGIRLVEPRCPECGYSQYSDIENYEKVFDVSAWDGSDFFMIWPMPKLIFMTPRATAFFTTNRIRNVTFARLKPNQIRGYGFSPGRLSFHMPAERAKQIGGPLGID